MRRFTTATRYGYVARRAAGYSHTQAAEAEGVKPDTALGWLNKGRAAADGEYAAFAAAVDAAEAVAAEAQADPVTPEEVLRHVSIQVRRGNVQAQRLAWEIVHAAEADKPEDTEALGGLDEVSTRRQRRAAA